MTLDQPVAALLAGAKHVLFVGAGGGYDILGSVPLADPLIREGKRVTLAGVTFTSVGTLPGAAPHPEFPHVFPITSRHADPDRYCPEAWLARWLEDTLDYREEIWLLKKCGVRPAMQAYEWLVESLGIDAVVLVDGGVDVLLKGNETSIGTPVEDLCSLAALSAIELPVRIVACIGFGSELRDGVRHAQVLERMAELTRAGAHLGTMGLPGGTDAGIAYREAVEHVFAHQRGQKLSHVQSVILAALRGEFGGDGADVWVSPLTSLYWFFDLAAVARTHVFLPHLAATETLFELTAAIRECRKAVAVRAPSDIPL